MFNARHIHKVWLVIVFLFLYCRAYCCPPLADTLRQDIFERVQNVPQANRTDSASSLYKRTFRHADETTAMTNLDRLNTIALTLNDKVLQCAIFNMRADYYSVNRGYNPLSTGYYKKAIEFAADNNLILEHGVYLNNMGRYLFIYKQYALACQYFLQSQEKFREIGFSNVPDMYSYLSQFADLYYRLGDFDNAKTNLVEALNYVARNNRDRINILNTIGLIYRNYKQFPIALNYFNRSLQLAVTNKDTVWIGITKGNIGSVYFLQGNYQKAGPYIKTDYTTSLKYGEPINGALALLRLIKINIDTKKYYTAYRQLDTVQLLIKNTPEDVLGLLANYSDLKSQLDEQTGHLKQSLAGRKLYEFYKDSILKRDNNTAVERVKLRYEIDQRINQQNRFESNEKIHRLELSAGIAMLILLMVISMLVYNRQRLKSKKDKELLIAEKEVVDERLKNAGIALHRFTENLRQKNALIENFKNEVDRLDKQSVIRKNAGNLESLLQAHIMTDDNWNDFKKLFSKVYPGFFVTLSKYHPHLSSTDTRILALIKLGLKNTEMANMLGITVEGIKKAKQRLRKKIDIQTINEIENSTFEG